MSAFSPSFGIPIQENVLLSRRCTLRVGGNARYAASPKTAEETALLIKEAKRCRMRYTVLGGGSNVLLDDEGYDGLILFTEAMKGLTFNGNIAIAEAGVPLSLLAKEAAARGLSGMEFLYGIPGTVGGAVVMNAGAFGSDISKILLSCTCLSDGQTVTRTGAECAFGYRKSIFQENGEILLSATFVLTKDEPSAVTARMEESLRIRKEKQPLSYPNAGSFFRNPEGMHASAMIDAAGLRGFRIGGAAVSEKHAGFLINLGGATAKDFSELIAHIQKVVFARTGIWLVTEVKHIE